MVVVNAFVYGLVAVGNEHLLFQPAGVVGAHKTQKLFDERAALAFGDEGGRLHGVDEQLDLRQFKFAADELVGVAAALFYFDVQTQKLQAFHVAVKGLAFRGDVVRPQVIRDLMDG